MKLNPSAHNNAICWMLGWKGGGGVVWRCFLLGSITDGPCCLRNYLMIIHVCRYLCKIPVIFFQGSSIFIFNDAFWWITLKICLILLSIQCIFLDVDVRKACGMEERHPCAFIPFRVNENIIENNTPCSVQCMYERQIHSYNMNLSLFMIILLIWVSWLLLKYIFVFIENSTAINVSLW